jgi:hypothetical protein
MKISVMLTVFSAFVSTSAFAGGARTFECEWLIPEFNVNRMPVDDSSLTVSLVGYLEVEAGGERFRTRCDHVEGSKWNKFLCVLSEKNTVFVEATTALVTINKDNKTCKVEKYDPKNSEKFVDEGSGI